MRSGDDSVTRRGVSPPRPHVAVAIHLQVEAEGRGLSGEPLAQGEIGIAPRESSISTGGRIATDGRDVRQASGDAHAPSRIGTRTSRSSATSSASS